MKSIEIKSVLAMAALVLGSGNLKAQTDSAAGHLQISGYLEAYYCYDMGKPSDHNRPAFVYSHNRHNEMNLNLGFVKAAYTNSKVRANLALMTGTYANANLAAEPGVLKSIYEANAGVALHKSGRLWADAGVFASHIGFESAIGKDCWNLTRSMMADNSPYYESGAKLTWVSKQERWLLSGLYLNGWQRIQRVNGNSTPAFGHQLTWKPTAKWTLNSSSFVGSDTKDSNRLMRYFHNFYVIWQPAKRFGIIGAFDIGAQQMAKDSNAYNTWYTAVVNLRYQISEKLTIAGRAEYYSDPGGVIISSGTPNGFKTMGASLNLDVQLAENMVWRIEGRVLKSHDQVFKKENQAVANNTFFTTSFAISF